MGAGRYRAARSPAEGVNFLDLTVLRPTPAAKAWTARRPLAAWQNLTLPLSLESGVLHLIGGPRLLESGARLRREARASGFSKVVFTLTPQAELLELLERYTR